MAQISIVIVNWNTKELVCQCLESILGQTTTDEALQVIVVDNGSNDGSQEAIRLRYNTVELIENDRNLGFAKANNIGIGASTGKYVCLVNSDVIVPEGAIGEMYKFMEENRGVGLLGPRIVGPDGSLQVSCKNSPSLWGGFCAALGLRRVFPESSLFPPEDMEDFPHDSIREVAAIAGCFWMARREAIDQVGRLSEDFFFYGEDLDWCRRFWRSGWRVIFYGAQHIVHFRKASSSKAPDRFYIEWHRSRLLYWKRHGNRLQQSVVHLILILHHVVRLAAGVAKYVFGDDRGDAILSLRRSALCLSWLFRNFRVTTTSDPI